MLCWLLLYAVIDMEIGKNGGDSYMNYRKFIILTCTLLYFLIAPAHCLRVYSPIEAGELELMSSYNYTVWMENQENRSYEIILSITPRSGYLDPYVTMSPNRFVIDPYERKGIDVTLNLPSDMAPGEHILTILPEVIEKGLSGTLTLGMSVIEIKFRIPGVVRKELRLSDFNITVNGEVEFKFIAENTGNVRLGAFPYVEIRRYYGSPATIVRGKTQYLIEPSSSVEMQLKHSEQSGTYYATAYLDYGETTNKITKEFVISTPESEIEEDRQETLPETEIIINETINITGEEEPEKRSEIRIRKLEIKPVYIGQPLSIILEIENIGPDNLTYELSINIFDINRENLGVISDSGTLDGYEIKRIEKEWSSNKTGDYNIKADILYGNNLANKEGKEMWTRVMKKTPTGFAIADTTSMATVAIVLIIILIVVFYRKIKIR